MAYKEIQKDNVKALASMEKAIACCSDDPRLLFEFDELSDINKASPEKKYEFLERNRETVKKSFESLLRLATRSVECGKYDEAITILTDNDICESEGAREMQITYLNAFTLRGMEYIKKGKLVEALKDFETDLAYPYKGKPNFYAQFYYLIGIVYEKLENPEEAETFFQKSLSVNLDARGSEYKYYHGLALQKLGKSNEAKQIFLNMLNDAQNEKEANLFFTQFQRGQSKDFQIATNHYLTGLAYEGLGEREKAKAEFANALRIIPSHVWSKVHLDSL